MRVSIPVAVAVLAKAPIPGFAKTRLIPRLGPEGAALVQARLTRRAVATACRAGIGPVSLWCAPEPCHPFFRAVAADFPITLNRQSDGDLGARMNNAFRSLSRHSPALVMGTDCVVLEGLHLVLCADLLCGGHDAVFLTVEDGGYILAGLRKCTPALFRDIPWNTPEVMTETRKRAQLLALRVAEPAMLWDIDMPKDYDRAIALRALLPETQAEANDGFGKP